MTVRVCSGKLFSSETVYSFAFSVVNPDFEQACPAITLDATAQDVNIIHRNMSVHSVELLGVANASCPLRVFKPQIVYGMLNQSVPFAESLNMLVLMLQINVDLRGDQQSSLTVSGLAGAKLEDELNVGKCRLNWYMVLVRWIFLRGVGKRHSDSVPWGSGPSWGDLFCGL